MSVTIKSPEEIEKMRIAGRLASEVLDYITPYVKPGVTTDELDRLCHEYMVSVQRTVPAPLNYAPPGYPPYEPPNPTPLRPSPPAQSDADAAHYYSVKEEPPPYGKK